jgi:RNA-binding protein YlmH
VSSETRQRLTKLWGCGGRRRSENARKTHVMSNSDVKVNWREVSKASREVAAGDVISCRGKGRLEIGDVNTTAKGRYAIEMTRFV